MRFDELAIRVGSARANRTTQLTRIARRLATANLFGDLADVEVNEGNPERLVRLFPDPAVLLERKIDLVERLHLAPFRIEPHEREVTITGDECRHVCQRGFVFFGKYFVMLLEFREARPEALSDGRLNAQQPFDLARREFVRRRWHEWIPGSDLTLDGRYLRQFRELRDRLLNAPVRPESESADDHATEHQNHETADRNFLHSECGSISRQSRHSSSASL